MTRAQLTAALATLAEIRDALTTGAFVGIDVRLWNTGSGYIARRGHRDNTPWLPFTDVDSLADVLLRNGVDVTE